ncbi:LTA synthase family protein [Bacillus shivajii]|uniref:LTA synthase family protein n=1 Tax=Bacillus shivajii TaxID=1983719 RepID=UPI001CF95BE9|nr:LTA synthase family protein [Bacillus shivajii]UCZ53102.1 LTA synthase family protein [Bacillus shivajii]
MKAFVRDHMFMIMCLVIIWLKTFVVSITTFQLTINQFIEGVTFALNPLAFLLVIFSIGLLMIPSVQRKYYFIVSLLLTVVLYSNAVYYREFSDIITLPMLVMSANMGDLSTSIVELVQWYDVFFFLDLTLVVFFLLKKPEFLTVHQAPFKQSKHKYAIIAVVALTIVGTSQADRIGGSENRAHSFNRDHLVQSIGLYNFYVYDAFVHLSTSTQTVFANENDWVSIEEHLDLYRVGSNDKYFGAAQDMNVVVVSMESVESFVIGEEVNGEEITPFLNELIDDSFYFENFYYQTGQGKTSDAEFLINNSLYPLGRGAVFHTHDENEYDALPKTLRDNSYYTASFHANDETFYNRDVMYNNLGYDEYFAFDDYEINHENTVGWGMKDIDWIEQSMKYVEELPEPFYGTFLTLTNHFPYELDEQDHFIEPFDSESEIVNRYFPTVRYTDEAMKVLVDELKEADLYENTILVMYGDHYGIAESHYDELSKFLGEDIGPYESVKLERVPLIIHVPGVEGETFDTVSGQVDVMPTLMNLLGIPADEHVMFGSDLLNENRDDFAVLRNGTVITDEVIYTSETCYENKTGDAISMDHCIQARDRGEWELFYSDKIIYGDLLRFK